MGKKYYCSKCKKHHYSDSEIGKKHITLAVSKDPYIIRKQIIKYKKDIEFYEKIIEGEYTNSLKMEAIRSIVESDKKIKKLEKLEAFHILKEKGFILKKRKK